VLLDTSDVGVAVADPGTSLAEIRAIAARVVAGCTIRRGLYYRYLLDWTKPEGVCGA